MLVVVEEGGDHGRAHAFAFGLRARGLIDDLVGARDGVAQHDGGPRQARSLRSSEPRSSRARPSRTRLVMVLTAMPLATSPALYPPMPSASTNKPDVDVGGDGVLVVFTDAARVGLADKGELALESHGLTPEPVDVQRVLRSHQCSMLKKRPLRPQMRPYDFPASCHNLPAAPARAFAISHTSPPVRIGKSTT